MLEADKQLTAATLYEMKRKTRYRTVDDGDALLLLLLTRSSVASLSLPLLPPFSCTPLSMERQHMNVQTTA